MAEVLLARTIGLGGFARHVVIKRIRVDHGSDQKAIDMFLDEARLVASLHHRNIVQVHDVGEEEGKYFFVMEYVHGRDTRELLRNVKDKKEQIPLEHVLTIVTAAAAGLHYAHEQRGPDRKPLNIVHRDISPGNILLAFDGGVKVVDFGIAKAEARSAETQAGEMKGKVGYMSPEQCRSQPIDRRTDIFQLGIVLYELCTVRRLFRADSRFETMAQIVDGSIALPTKWRKDIPQDLERIIVKTLAKTPEERYQSADELRLVLEAFASRAGLPLSPGRLSDYLKDQFGEVPEPWLVDEHVPPPPPEVIERIRSSSQLIAVGRPSQPMVAMGKPEPVVAQEPSMTAESVDAEPIVPPLPAPRPDPEPEPGVADVVAPVVDEPVAAPSSVEPAVEAKVVPSTRSTQPELEALKVAKPVIPGVPAGPEEDEPPLRRSQPVYPAYPSAPRSYRWVFFVVAFLVIAGGIAGAFWFLSTELEQTKAAAPADPLDAAVVAPDASSVTESATVDAGVAVVIDAAVEASAIDAGATTLDAGVTRPASDAAKPPAAATKPGPAATKPATDVTKPAADVAKPAPTRPKPVRPRPATKPKPKPDAPDAPADKPQDLDAPFPD